MAASLAKLPRPFLVSVIREANPDDAVALIRNSEYDGAEAYDVHMNILEKKYRNYKDLRRIINSTARPLLFLYYRTDPIITDEERIDDLLLGLEAGAAGIDIIADYYDPSPWLTDSELVAYSLNRESKPREVSMKPEIIEKQKILIDKVHAMGREVLLSAHTRVVLKTEQIIPIALEMESRGPDMIKIVTICLTEDDLLESFRTVVELKRTLSVPFQFQCHGQHGKLLRVVGPMLGSMLVFCNQRYKPGTHPDQPLLRATRDAFQNIDWFITQTSPEDSLTIT